MGSTGRIAPITAQATPSRRAARYSRNRSDPASAQWRSSTRIRTRGAGREVDRQPVQPVEHAEGVLGARRLALDRALDNRCRQPGCAAQQIGACVRGGLKEDRLKELPRHAEREVTLKFAPARRQHRDPLVVRAPVRHIEQRGLPDPRLTLNEQRSSLPSEQVTEQSLDLLQLGYPFTQVDVTRSQPPPFLCEHFTSSTGKDQVRFPTRTKAWGETIAASGQRHDREKGTATMSTLQDARSSYALERTAREYDRLRAQSQAWESASARLLDRIALAPGARCVDVGCGPGETMRLMAERVGPSGRVVGIDVDAAIGGQAVAMLRDAGHRHCEFLPADVSCDDVPEGPFDLVYARLLLYHLPERVAVLRRLWEAVAPGGHLLVQDYDLRAVGVLPALASVDELTRVIVAAFTAAGCDVHVGSRLPDLFVRSGVGPPDGTDVAGRLEPFGVGHALLTGVYRSLIPTAIARGITDEPRTGRCWPKPSATLRGSETERCTGRC